MAFFGKNGVLVMSCQIALLRLLVIGAPDCCYFFVGGAMKLAKLSHFSACGSSQIGIVIKSHGPIVQLSLHRCYLLAKVVRRGFGIGLCRAKAVLQTEQREHADFHARLTTARAGAVSAYV